MADLSTGDYVRWSDEAKALILAGKWNEKAEKGDPSLKLDYEQEANAIHRVLDYFVGHCAIDIDVENHTFFQWQTVDTAFLIPLSALEVLALEA